MIASSWRDSVSALELDVQERDRYGRLLAYVWVERDGTAVLVNAELLASGTSTS